MAFCKVCLKIDFLGCVCGAVKPTYGGTVRLQPFVADEQGKGAVWARCFVDHALIVTGLVQQGGITSGSQR